MSQVPGSPRGLVPRGLEAAAAYSWRLLLVGVVGWLVLRAAERFYLVVLPVIAALLLSALAMPAVRRLRQLRVPAAPSALLVILFGLGTVGGVVWWITTLALAQAGQLTTQLSEALDRLPVRSATLRSWRDTAVQALEKHSGGVSGVLTGLHIVGNVVAGSVLTLFVLFYLLYDGARVWSWLVGLLPRDRRSIAHEAGARAWERLAGWVRGTVIIGLVHAGIVAVALLALRVPLVAPLAVLVFLGSFIPIVGAVLFGGVAVLVAFAVHGWVAALVLIGVLTLDNQLEAHILQPFLVGRYVRLHPLVVILAVTAGEVLEGLVGAILAVPVTAACYAAFSYARTATATAILLPGDEEPVSSAELLIPPTAEPLPREGRNPLEP